MTVPSGAGTIRERLVEGWQPIETAPSSGYIIGAWRDGDRWMAAQLFNEYDEWVDVRSDAIRRPTHWMPLPAASPLPGDGSQ